MRTLWTGVVLTSLALAPVALSDDAAVTSPTSEGTATPDSPKSRRTHPTLAWATQEVLKLCRARVSEETVMAFVGRATTSFDLTADDILYLKEQGVSERVLNAMLSQRPNPGTTVAAAAVPSPTNSGGGGKASVLTAPGVPQTPTVVYQQPPPTVVYQQAPPVVVRSSPTYVYSAPYYSSYGCYPYYGWGYPRVSLSFGFGYYGGHWGGYRGGYCGGYRGGFYHGGGYHGGRR